MGNFFKYFRMLPCEPDFKELKSAFIILSVSNTEVETSMYLCQPTAN